MIVWWCLSTIPLPFGLYPALKKHLTPYLLSICSRVADQKVLPLSINTSVTGLLCITIQPSKLFHRTLLGNPDTLWPFPLFLYPPPSLYSSELLQHTWVLQSPLHHHCSGVLPTNEVRPSPSPGLSLLPSYPWQLNLCSASFHKLPISSSWSLCSLYHQLLLSLISRSSLQWFPGSLRL